MTAGPMQNPDITEQLARISRCRRCECHSCQEGYENHSYSCTDGPHCVETQTKLKALLFPYSVIAGRARETIRELRVETATLRARVAQLEAIHHG